MGAPHTDQEAPMTIHTIRLGSINEVAHCAACHDWLLYVEDDGWVHVRGDAAHAAVVEFEVSSRPPKDGAFAVGDGFVLEAPEGSWLGEAYDVSSRGWTAHVMPDGTERLVLNCRGENVHTPAEVRAAWERSVA